jgi:hypothetical protein
LEATIVALVDRSIINVCQISDPVPIKIAQMESVQIKRGIRVADRSRVRGGKPVAFGQQDTPVIARAINEQVGSAIPVEISCSYVRGAIKSLANFDGARKICPLCEVGEVRPRRLRH